MKYLRYFKRMKFEWVLNTIRKQSFGFVPIFSLMIFSTLVIFTGLSNAYSVETYSIDDTPFGSPLDIWMNKFWQWWVPVTIDQATPKPDACLINSSNPMVFLMETSVKDPPRQICKISSNQSIAIPLWGAFMEDSISPQGEQPFKGYSYEQLSKEAREQADLGAVTSLVKVDGVPVAKLDVVSSMRAGKLDYKINSMDNVTELYSKGFNVTIPEDTHFPDQNIGTWRSGAHGWWTFLKPLPPGDHTIEYNVGVTGTGPNDHSSEISYDLDVK
jgi:hypothetical protein